MPANKYQLDQKAKQNLFELLRTPSVIGFESRGQQKWLAFMQERAELLGNDSYGNAWAALLSKQDKKNVKLGKEKFVADFDFAQLQAPSLMIAAHADEIGFMVSHIEKDGFLRLTTAGGSDAEIARGRRLRLFGDKGELLGVIGSIAIHMRRFADASAKKSPKVHELFVDIGASSRKEVLEAGVRPGTPAVYEDEVAEYSHLPSDTNAKNNAKNNAKKSQAKNPTRIVGRGIDNRVSGFILTEIFRQLANELANEKLAWNIIAVNAVHEEIGGMGAMMATRHISPEAAIVIDVTHATDTPDVSQANFGKVELGQGFTLSHGAANHPKLVNKLQKIAAKHNLKYQHEATSRATGTDTDKVYCRLSGVVSALLSIPLRYMHTPVETIDLNDVSETIILLSEFCKNLKTKDNFAHNFAAKSTK